MMHNFAAYILNTLIKFDNVRIIDTNEEFFFHIERERIYTSNYCKTNTSALLDYVN